MTDTLPIPRILLVEDNVFDVELARTAFEVGDLVGEPAVAFDGQDALDYLYRQGRYRGRADEAPRLVLLDLHMPRMNGLDVLRRVKQDATLRNIPMVVFTTSNAPADREACAALGADDYLVKPNDFGMFVTLIESLKARWLDGH
ncbi:response regulator [Deinococcus peraridilitoris]|uniref:Response regulator with CheY-like receiver domain and winged-helix DNA-binding domain protein n=1 Tax=Deinococcus peraridilitoris (strain DSM 19664 / LMG 22246 / CIP 109416 / KR-200) TaxID=937777 RepID=K9ZYN5_DEIPD|nr:response regulator [Deinococcus peraridilitoris]AFZ65870.1 response regulator with CheY-like receiver domain and winged-helix DNA-binding domain protein [Deinococcus peraridilitoris DSM 19664]